AGMGYARSAELNRYPGPMHVLELAEPLKLTSEQRAATKALMDSHKAEARALGAKLIESERALDRLFREGGVEPAKLADAVEAAERFHRVHRERQPGLAVAHEGELGVVGGALGVEHLEVRRIARLVAQRGEVERVARGLQAQHELRLALAGLLHVDERIRYFA